MKTLFVVENRERWPLHPRGAEVISARDYLTGEGVSGERGLRVYNFCRSYGYHTLGYYVSLLATARGHRPLPTVETLQDLRLAPLVRIVSSQLQEQIQRCFSRLISTRFELSIYFGRNLAKRYDALSRAIYEQFPVPLLRASFRKERKEWKLVSVRPIATSEIPDSHRDFVIERAEQQFGRRVRSSKRRTYRYELAILGAPDAGDTPSGEPALRRFAKAARELGIDAQRIDHDDAPEIASFDALFLRETTSVDHATYRLARRAEAEGLVVIDDPISIVRCSNKVFLAELFARHEIPHPKTVVAHTNNLEETLEAVGLPCVLKRPDSSFSQGVSKARTAEEFHALAGEFLRDSALVVAQAFTPSEFDWRIGVLGGEPLFACRYYMARGHWQVVSRSPRGRERWGRSETLSLEDTPKEALDIAVRAARLVGDGLYGVDIKEVHGGFLVIEVNDNPNVDVGCEDAVIGDRLYLAVMDWFRHRLDSRGQERGRRVD